MKTRKLRLLSFVLAVAMMFAVMPVSAFAAPEDDHTVTVTTTGGLQAAVEAKYGADNLDSITELIVKTADGAALNQADFQFLSGVVVSVAPDGRYASNYTPDTISCLKNLQTLDLTDAVGVFTEANGTTVYNVIPPRAFQKNKTIKKILLPKNLVRT